MELDIFPPFLADSGLITEAQEGNTDPNSITVGNGGDGFEINDFRFICINNNNNIVVEGEEPTVPPTPPEPTTPGSLTVKKAIFGCDNISQSSIFIIMDCTNLQNNSPDWLSCDHLDISNTIFCQALPENFFDIEVLDEQDIQIQQFEGSGQGTTIENLQPVHIQ